MNKKARRAYEVYLSEIAKMGEMASLSVAYACVGEYLVMLLFTDPS